LLEVATESSVAPEQRKNSQKTDNRKSHEESHNHLLGQCVRIGPGTSSVDINLHKEMLGKA
jgi:hypothetical protein